MAEELYNEPIYSKNVLEFIRVAHEYCLFIEKSEIKKEHLLEFFQRIGPLLYLKGTLLPDIEVMNAEANERFVTEEEYESIFNDIRSKLLPYDEFWYLDYDLSVDNEPVKASLAENLSDIYQELKDFILLYQKHTHDSKENAVKECKSLFETRWGPKILNSLGYIHYLLNKDKSAEPEY
jgi:hypothetical protein